MVSPVADFETANTCKCLLVAIDAGACATLAPLQGYDGFQLIDNANIRCTTSEQWMVVLKQVGCASVIVGTSDSQYGYEVESAARVAAAETRLTTTVIEDYPGSYQPVEGANTDVLIVESAFARELHQKRLGTACPQIWVCKNARYDPLRRIASELRKRVGKVWRSPSRSQQPIMWAGQPETEDSLNTLRYIAPDLAQMNAYLLFKAHPRDRGYESGIYKDLFQKYGLVYRDVTSLNLDRCMEFAPRAVFTQFSSVAIEAGFYGVPSVHILYKDIGFRRLYKKKGFGIPPWCTRKAAFLITDTREHSVVLSKALLDGEERASTIRNFDDYFGVPSEVAPFLAKKISQTVTCRM